MRRALFVALLTLATVACGRDAPRTASSGANGSNDPDAVVLRIPRGGGTATAAIYPNVDSVVWRAPGAPGPRNFLAFDPEGGSVAYVTATGLPARLDLRLGRATIASRQRLQSLASTDGANIYGVDDKGEVVRLSGAGSWTYAPASRARSVYPQLDGSAVVASSLGAQTTLWKIIPPDDRAVDTAYLPPVGRAVRTQLGDHLYFTTDTGLVGVRARDLEPTASVRLRRRVVALAPTPSGDRLYVLLASDPELRVVERFAVGAEATVRLPAPARDLRMDPLGRYLLARAATGDSAWVVDVGASRVLGAVRGEWSADLPAIAPDGTVAALAGRDVVFVNPDDGAERKRVAGGARDFWIFVWWNGFRPRASGIDRPVTFAPSDTAPLDSATVDSTPPVAPAAAETTATAQAPSPAPARFLVSFAALLSEQRARALADSLNAAGLAVRVASSDRDGTAVHRVVAGPYPTRAAAEAAGAASRRSYWVYEDR